MKIEDLETKLAASEMAKSASETLSSDIEHDLKKEKDSEICQLNLKIEVLKKETHEANQIRAKVEQDLSKEKEIAQKFQQSLKNEIDSLKVEISEKSANFEMEKTGLETKLKEVEYNLKKDAEEAKENCTKLEDDLLRKTKSFDELIWSWAELKKFEEEKKIQSRNDERFEMGKSFKSILQNRAMQGISKWCL